MRIQITAKANISDLNQRMRWAGAPATVEPSLEYRPGLRAQRTCRSPAKGPRLLLAEAPRTEAQAQAPREGEDQGLFPTEEVGGRAAGWSCCLDRSHRSLLFCSRQPPR